jgi:hypothetical protein
VPRERLDQRPPEHHEGGQQRRQYRERLAQAAPLDPGVELPPGQPQHGEYPAGQREVGGGQPGEPPRWRRLHLPRFQRREDGQHGDVGDGLGGEVDEQEDVPDALAPPDGGGEHRDQRGIRQVGRRRQQQCVDHGAYRLGPHVERQADRRSRAEQRENRQYPREDARYPAAPAGTALAAVTPARLRGPGQPPVRHLDRATQRVASDSTVPTDST